MPILEEYEIWKGKQGPNADRVVHTAIKDCPTLTSLTLKLGTIRQEGMPRYLSLSLSLSLSSLSVTLSLCVLCVASHSMIFQQQLIHGQRLNARESRVNRR